MFTPLGNWQNAGSPQRYVLTVQYDVVGTTHDGYCSGAEEYEGNSRTDHNTVVMQVTGADLPQDLSDLDFYGQGCGIGHGPVGSGYCSGYGSECEAQRVLIITDTVRQINSSTDAELARLQRQLNDEEN